MIYLIDHEDSFTFNLAHLLGQFEDVMVSNYYNINLGKLNKASTIVLSPGPGEPKDYPITEKIYKKYRINGLKRYQSYFNKKNSIKLIDYLKNEKNDLEKIVIKIYPKIGEIINYIKSQKGCLFSRISGSGSACIGIFSNRHNTISAQKLIRSKYPKYWCVLAKTI